MDATHFQGVLDNLTTAEVADSKAKTAFKSPGPGDESSLGRLEAAAWAM